MVLILLFSILDCLKYNLMPGSVNTLHKEFDKLEEQKKSLMHLISTLTDENFTRQPSPDSWSVAQAANHIFMSEQLSTAYIRKKLSYPDTLQRFQFRSWPAVWLLKFVLWSPYKRKAPQAINMWDNQTILSREDLDVKWSALRKDMITLIDEHQPTFGKHMVYRHPYAGRMTMHQMLIFFNDHMAHHIRQVNKIMKAINSEEKKSGPL
jgi:uncharacterized damage-inducible protein DinB